ncbi:MAG: hypothetical protein KJ666_01125 [Bacteroidetes bacterium]|nr:hypothetical protein [Bacteroidota bacterium]MBU2585211.1 hypothetical protein [Bacteroidota bacterium]
MGATHKETTTEIIPVVFNAPSPFFLLSFFFVYEEPRREISKNREKIITYS